MKSNDSLLQYMVAKDQEQRGTPIKHSQDELTLNPSMIHVGANEVVYIHFFHCVDPKFYIDIITPTQTVRLSQINTVGGSNNTVIRALGTVRFNQNISTFFHIQYLRIFY